MQGQATPVGLAGHAVGRQMGQCLRDLGQRHSHALGHLDHGHPPQHRSCIAALIACGARTLDQALLLIEMQGRYRHPAAAGDLSHTEIRHSLSLGHQAAAASIHIASLFTLHSHLPLLPVVPAWPP